MRRSAAIAISVMLAATVFMAAAPLAFADDGGDHGDHAKCTAGMACGTARPGGSGDEDHEQSSPAAQATSKSEVGDVDENDTDADENATAAPAATASPDETAEPSETEEPSMSPAATAAPTASPTASPSASPSATASPGATTGNVDFAALQQLIAMIRDFFASLAASLGSSGNS